MSSPLNVDWSHLYSCRQEVRARYRTIWSLPLVKKEMDRLLALTGEHADVLEVGAGDRRFKRKLHAVRPGIRYKSLDIDRSTEQDFYALDDVVGCFDLIFAFELVEHLTPQEGLNMLVVLKRHLKPKGVLLVGTPNLYDPHRYFGDLTHKTPFKYEELGALMRLAGFAVPKLYRIYNAAFIQRILRLWVGVWLHRYLDIDFAHTVLAEATIDFAPVFHAP